MSVITVKIPDELNASLELEAKARRVSKSEVVREALTEFLARQQMRSRSAYDAMKSACGVVKKGPPDLSTNKKYLTGNNR